MVDEPVLLLHDSVLLRGAAVPATLRMIAFAIQRNRRDNGYEPGPLVTEVFAQLTAAQENQAPDAMSSGRHASPQVTGTCRADDMESAALRAEWATRDEIGTGQVAALLGLSVRQVQRLAATFGGRRVPGGRWVFSRGNVEEFAFERHQDRSTR